MQQKRFSVIALLSASMIAMEMVWTRIFSAEFFYTFAFLILSLAIMGLGLGSLSVRLFKKLNNEKILPLILLLTAAAMFLGPILLFRLNINFAELFSSKVMILKFILAVLILNSSYFLGGIGLSLLLKTNHQEMDRMYMADLLGAGSGVVLAILLMNFLSTPVATFIISLPILIAAFMLYKSRSKLIPVILAVIFIAMAPLSDHFLQAKRDERAPVSYTHWDAVSKIKVYDFAENYKGINIDNMANTPVYGFDGNWDKPDSEKFQFSIDVEYLIRENENCTFLALGAGGGVDVLQALQYGAEEIHAVEVNPHINYLLTDGELAEFSGNIYQDPRVKVITEDARAYIRRFSNKFDMIYSLSSNSFSAMASGSFALAENYLFTTEAFEDYWNSMTENGYMMMEHQFYIPRLVSELTIALKNCGIENPTDHFAVFNLPNMRRKMLLISKNGLTDETIAKAFGNIQPGTHNWTYPLYPVVHDTLENKLITSIIENGWQEAQKEAPFDISPTSDNRPFIAQMGLWKNFSFQKLNKVKPYEFFGFPLSKMIIVIILSIVFILIIPVNLLPYFLSREKLNLVPWLYFFAIGMGFMMVEIVLMQQFTLFIGSSVYSMATILITMLIFSGIGSRNSTKFHSWIPFCAIAVWLILDILVFSKLFYLLGGMTLIPRVLISISMIAPLAFFMGMPFPKAGLRVGELIDWGFAVNGAASTIGATVVLVIAFSGGYSAALLIAGLIYLLALMLYSLKKAW